MSVLITLKITADTEAFRAYAAANGDTMKAISEEGKSLGGIHHRFGIGDGFILVIDEWDTAEAFQGFFEGNEAIGAIMAAVGAQGEPEMTFAEALASADEF
jgi:hypothetical protein